MAKLSSEDWIRKFQHDIFPDNWTNPSTAEPYDLLIIGGGPGGITSAVLAKSYDARVAIVEKEHLGGECLSYGCIPSKALLRSSRIAHDIQNAGEYGIVVPKGWKVDFKAVMERVYRAQATISTSESTAHIQKLGIDVYLGVGHFTGPNSLQVQNQTIRFKKALIVTGTQPNLLDIPNLESSEYWTNQNIFTMSILPRRLAVIGGGPISCELSQAFLRFGSEVSLVTRGPHLLPKEDNIAKERLQKVFEKEGMKIFTQSQVERVEKQGKEKHLYIGKSKERIVADEILVAIGRKPAVEGLNLESAGIQYDKQAGIMTNDYLQTSNPHIYAAGDVASPYKFTHMSQELAKKAVMNALNGNQEKSHALIVPWCTYTDPEIAHVGLSEEGAKKQGVATEVIKIEMADVDRAIVDGQTTGFLKFLIKENTDQIIGATLMAPHAGDMISELSVAMVFEKGLIALSKAIHPFPTKAKILQMAADRLLKKRRSLQKAVTV